MMRPPFSPTLPTRLVGAAGVALLAMVTQASAVPAVTPVFTVTPNSILQGEQSTLELTLTLLPEPGFDSAQFLTGTVKFIFGDGDSHSFFISGGPQFEDFIFAHTYSTAGIYTPGFDDLGFFIEENTQLQTSQIRDFGGALEPFPTLTVLPTPLPAALPLFASGLGLMGWLARWKKGWFARRNKRNASA